MLLEMTWPSPKSADPKQHVPSMSTHRERTARIIESSSAAVLAAEPPSDLECQVHDVSVLPLYPFQRPVNLISEHRHSLPRCQRRQTRPLQSKRQPVACKVPKRAAVPKAAPKATRDYSHSYPARFNTATIIIITHATAFAPARNPIIPVSIFHFLILHDNHNITPMGTPNFFTILGLYGDDGNYYNGLYKLYRDYRGIYIYIYGLYRFLTTTTATAEVLA